MTISEENILRIAVMLKFEDEITKSMQDFGYDHRITFSDLTRDIRKDPKLLKMFEKVVKMLK